MGVKPRAQMRVWRELIPTRFALARKPTSPFQGEVDNEPTIAFMADAAEA
jgi:hypothetical protein